MGIKTLPMRMERHFANARRIATALELNEQVKKRVRYLAFPPTDHEIAKRHMKAFGGVMSFEVRGGRDAAIRVMKKFRAAALSRQRWARWTHWSSTPP